MEGGEEGAYTATLEILVVLSETEKHITRKICSFSIFQFQCPGFTVYLMLTEFTTKKRMYLMPTLDWIEIRRR